MISVMTLPIFVAIHVFILVWSAPYLFEEMRRIQLAQLLCLFVRQDGIISVSHYQYVSQVGVFGNIKGIL